MAEMVGASRSGLLDPNQATRRRLLDARLARA